MENKKNTDLELKNAYIDFCQVTQIQNDRV